MAEFDYQDLVKATEGFSPSRLIENQLKALKEKAKEPPAREPESDSTSGKTFIDAGAFRKRSHINGERQYVCHYEGCGKKFSDSSKLKRHILIHTGERDFVCPHEGCGIFAGFQPKVTHENTFTRNYHFCPYPECGKRYAHEYKPKNHLSAHHEKHSTADTGKYTTPLEKISKVPRPSAAACGSAPSDRPYACLNEGCIKAYIDEYELKIHLRREHPGHMSDENAENAATNVNEMDEASDQVAYAEKRINGKSQKQSRSKPRLKMPPPKITQRKGENGKPFIPEIPGMDSFPGEVVHSSAYKCGSGFENKQVLVVGSGNSGMEISFDLSSHGAYASLVVRRPVHVVTKQLIYMGMVLLKYLPMWFVDAMVTLLSRMELGDLSKFGIHRPRRGPFTHKIVTGQTPVLDVGTVNKIHTGEIKVVPAIDSINGNMDYNYILNEEGMPRNPFPNHWKGENGAYCVGLARDGISGVSKDAIAVADDINGILSHEEKENGEALEDPS
ncbi:hypothetical protein GH714_005441 [Hevea brasiliensis]|uniref:Flavin-containing monooxygenase n=1 Tax=Hevea brasiliensis TaxID=3981 RepID=A0A6A6L0P7_HEVBR|nr:hypothetical protein GH714_005441 [Hevea brasiliensis]